MSRLREIAAPFVAAAPAGARVRTRLHVSGQDEVVLRAVGRPSNRKPAAPRGQRQPPGDKTGPPNRTTAGNQATQDRPGPPTGQYSLLRSD
jgi:hypothetical protein